MAIALRHGHGRVLDLHPIAQSADGGGDQIQVDGTRWHYDPAATGWIAGIAVACCSAETQIRSHLGYEPDDDDWRDMLALAERFGCSLPLPYVRK